MTHDLDCTFPKLLADREEMVFSAHDIEAELLSSR